MEETMKLTAHSVDPVRLPTEFGELNEDLSVYEKPYVDCSGCENIDASAIVREKLSNAIRNSPELIWDHWNPQDKNLRRKIAKLHGVDVDQVFITSGAIAAIDYCFKIFTVPGTTTGLLMPDWPGFLHYVEFHKNKVEYLENLTFPFVIESEEISKFVQEKDIDMMLIANPIPVNGHLIEKNEVEKMLQKNPQTLFVIDEADTISPHKQAASLVNNFDNAIFIGSLSKFYGLSGLRIGYVITPRKYSLDFKNTINCIEVSSLAILAGNLVLDDAKYQEETQQNVKESIRVLQEACKNSPFEIYATPDCFACYIYSEEIDPKEILDKAGIKILEGTYFGLPKGTFGGRINLSNPDHIRKIAKAIKDYLVTSKL